MNTKVNVTNSYVDMIPESKKTSTSLYATGGKRIMGAFGNTKNHIYFQIRSTDQDANPDKFMLMAEVFVWQEYSRSQEANYSEHARVGKKARSEYTNDTLEEITLGITLFQSVGGYQYDKDRTVWKQKTDLEKFLKNRISGYLILGGHKVSNSKFVLTSIQEQSSTWGALGEPLTMDLDVTFKEYF